MGAPFALMGAAIRMMNAPIGPDGHFLQRKRHGHVA
jgi:hypothetical protein